MATMQPKQNTHDYADGDEDGDFQKKRYASNNRGAAQSEAQEESFQNKYVGMTSKDREGADSTPSEDHSTAKAST
jgi:hypothetical protein